MAQCDWFAIIFVGVTKHQWDDLFRRLKWAVAIADRESSIQLV